MRQFIDIVENALIETDQSLFDPSNFNGFWVTDEGEIIYTDFANELHHDEIAGRYFKSGDPFVEALRSGWVIVRLYPPQELNVLWGDDPSLKALKVVRQYASQNSYFENYFIEGMTIDPNDDEKGIDLVAFMRLLNQRIEKAKIDERNSI